MGTDGKRRRVKSIVEEMGEIRSERWRAASYRVTCGRLKKWGVYCRSRMDNVPPR
jgi:hypothetical protein